MPGPDDEHLVAEVALGHRRPLGPQLRHRRRDDRGVEVGERRRRAARAGCAARRRARRPSTRARSRSASARRARRRDRSPKWVWVLPTSTTRSMGGSLCFGPCRSTLYVVHGSHPCAAVERALELKGARVPSAIELPPPLHAPLQRVRFGARTVPGADARRRREDLGSRAIMRRLEELAPEPSLLPGRRRARAPRSSAPRSGATRSAADRAAPAVGRARARSPRRSSRYQEARGCPLPAPGDAALAPRDRPRRAPAQRRDRGRRPRRPARAARPPRPHRRLARRRRDRRRDAQRRRPPDRDDARGCCSRSATSRRSSPAARPRRTRARSSPPQAGSSPARRATPPTGSPGSAPAVQR